MSRLTLTELSSAVANGTRVATILEGQTQPIAASLAALGTQLGASQSQMGVTLESTATLVTQLSIAEASVSSAASTGMHTATGAIAEALSVATAAQVGNTATNAVAVAANSKAESALSQLTRLETTVSTMAVNQATISATFASSLSTLVVRRLCCDRAVVDAEKGHVHQDSKAAALLVSSRKNSWVHTSSAAPPIISHVQGTVRRKQLRKIQVVCSRIHISYLAGVSMQSTTAVQGNVQANLSTQTSTTLVAASVQQSTIAALQVVPCHGCVVHTLPALECDGRAQPRPALRSTSS